MGLQGSWHIEHSPQPRGAGLLGSSFFQCGDEPQGANSGHQNPSDEEQHVKRVRNA